jgi:transposase
MNVKLDFSDCTLSTAHQAMVEALNKWLTWLPDDEDPAAALRLAVLLLEAGDVAPQAVLARAVGLNQARSVRRYKQRLREEGLDGLFDHPIPGRPAITTKTAVETALLQVILEAVIHEHALPDDTRLAERINQSLGDTQEPEVTASMVETIRLRWGIRRPSLTQQLQAAPPAAEPEPDLTRLGQTRVGGAFILAVLLVETGWLQLTHLLPMAANYAVTATQWLLTAIFAVIFGVQRAFHLDDVRDIGFALVTGRPRPLTHGTFQHLLHAIPGDQAQAFYAATARLEVQTLAAGDRRISLDGHNLPRYTRIVDVVKGKIGNTGRILKAEELVLAYDLDAHRWLAVRVYQGAKKLSWGIVAIVEEILKHRGDREGVVRIFADKGAYAGHVFQPLAAEERVHFYIPAVRYASNVEQWEQLRDTDFDTQPFSFDKHAALPADQRPVYRLADTQMEINVWQDQQVIATVALRAVVLHDPAGKTPAARWPVAFLTDDRDIEARALLNEYGDHWGQEFAHGIGKYDLGLDILPPGYVLRTHRDAQGQLVREVEEDDTAFFLSAWLRCLVFNLMTGFAQAMGGEYIKMWAGTLLRKFIRRPATLYLMDKELHVVFDPFPDQDELQPLLDKLNAKRTALPWLNNLVVQFRIAKEEPLHPLTAPEKRNRLFGDG